ncbi:xanthine dehydrogenase family protein molybdopterin-binding subunit [Zavarzinia sp. CC-PAN008]|uniref:xanthine dehydrogenase family protein molybdopterin-binding subunit n=1 Tax=Zavarzinia sp. CC-PAN008 TaxID=3243332 RepID=UPI003F74889C
MSTTQLAPGREPQIGRPVPRFEDATLVQGRGRYADDVTVPGQVHGVFVRSPFAHGMLNGIDAEAARAMPGVLGVFSAADLDAAGYGTLQNIVPFTNADGSPMKKPARPALPRDRVRHVGEAVALVVAETLDQARAAVEAVVLDVEMLEAVTDARAAFAEGAPQLYEDVPRNLCLDFEAGQKAAVEQAFAVASHVTRLDIASNRLIVNPMEPRSGLAEYDAATERWTFHVSSQGVFALRGALAEILKVPPERLRVLTNQVGGSFGMKAFVFPEHVCLLHAARALGRPVKWTDQRSESFLADTHGRDQEVRAELALDGEGHFLAVRLTGFANNGSALTPPSPLWSAINFFKNLIGVYRTPVAHVAMKCTFTNTTPIGAYRGAGRPEANYFMERLVDAAAAELGLDPAELRRRNHIAPDQMPYDAPNANAYDSGEFGALLERALAAADWDGFAARKASSAARGLLRGHGIGQYLEVTAPPRDEMGGIRFDEDGGVTIITGTLDYGQGHAAPFAQVLADRLGIPLEAIRLLQGDSDELLTGGGTGGSRSIIASGTAIVEASQTVIERGRAIAGAVLEASEADIEFADGRFAIAGTDRGIALLDLAQRLRRGLALPEGMARSLDVRQVSQNPPSTFPNGCHVAEVEIDPETGVVHVDRYVMVNDFGTVINPLVVEGQLHGGVVQGIGQALHEATLYSEEGQLLTGSFMDYGLPRADDVPFMAFESRPVPATTNVLGVKGCGEAGCAGGLPAIMNAVVDALSARGIRHIDMPATPHRIWQALQGRKGLQNYRSSPRRRG